MRHELPVRVYYEDTDAGGIVYHANYLKFFDRGRVESLKALGFEVVSLWTESQIQFAVHSAALEFLQPARLGQLLYVVSEIDNVGHASIMFNQQICKETAHGPVICRAKIRIACLNNDHRPTGMPERVKKRIVESIRNCPSSLWIATAFGFAMTQVLCVELRTCVIAKPKAVAIQRSFE